MTSNSKELITLAERLEVEAVRFAKIYAGQGGTSWIEQAANCVTVAAALRARATQSPVGSRP